MKTYSRKGFLVALTGIIAGAGTAALTGCAGSSRGGSRTNDGGKRGGRRTNDRGKKNTNDDGR